MICPDCFVLATYELKATHQMLARKVNYLQALRQLGLWLVQLREPHASVLHV
jgi:hypothetical protein